jgi:hypothetical protein
MFKTPAHFLLKEFNSNITAWQLMSQSCEPSSVKFKQQNKTNLIILSNLIHICFSPYPCLEACQEIHEEWVSDFICNFKDVPF